MELRIEPAYDNAQAVETLFSEYTNMLIEGDSTFREYLNLQNYDEEVKHPEQKIIEDDREIGYSHMLLDTLPFLKSNHSGCIKNRGNTGLYKKRAAVGAGDDGVYCEDGEEKPIDDSYCHMRR